MMKKITQYVTILFALTVLLTALIGCKKSEKPQVNQSKLSCIVQLTEGQVTFLSDKNLPVTLNAGDEVGESWTVSTSEESFAEIMVAGRTLVRIKPLSMVKIASLLKTETQEQAKVQLFSGQVLTRSEKLPESATFEIATQSITTGIRGTTYEVTEENGVSKVAVEEGQVAVRKNYKIASLNDIEKKDKALADNLNQSIYQEELVNQDEQLEVKKEDFDKTEQELNQQVDQIKEDLNKNEKVKEETISDIESRSRITTKKEISEDDKERIRSDKEVMETRIDQEENETSLIPVFIEIKADKKTRFTVFRNGSKFRKVRNSFSTRIRSDKITEFTFSSGDYPDQIIAVDPASFKKGDTPVIQVEFKSGSSSTSQNENSKTEKTVNSISTGKVLIGTLHDKGKMGGRFLKFPEGIDFNKIILVSKENTTEILNLSVTFQDKTKLKLKENFEIQVNEEYAIPLDADKPVDRIFIQFKNKEDNTKVTRIEVYGLN